MQTEVYRKLQSHLHKHPLGFPATEKEAEMALNLTLMPETATILA